MPEASFTTDLTVEDCTRFAELSGDWNPLHSNPDHAARSTYGRQVLHGAFSAGLISRLAGMFLPGTDCLLYGMRLRFVAPILPPARVVIHGKLAMGTLASGRVDATLRDARTGGCYVEASYEFGQHRMGDPVAEEPRQTRSQANDEPLVLITGANGGLGSALRRRLGARARPLARHRAAGGFDVSIDGAVISEDTRVAAIVHCGWPQPDNRRLLELEDPGGSIDYHVAAPLRDVQALAALLARFGGDRSSLVLIGSTFAQPGRHYYRMPLYSIAKSMIPTVVNVLALELAAHQRRCLGVVFDVIDGGMNKGITEAARVAAADRSPWGELASPDEAAEQIVWLLDNDSRLASGATITLSAGAVP